MSAEEIRKSALKCFSQYGYEGTSLSMITAEIGMKKQSIYAHFKSKEDIYTSVLNLVIQDEEEFLDDYFSRNYDSAAECLNNFLTIIKERYISHNEYNMKFIIGVSYMPPEKLAPVVNAKCNSYFDKIATKVVEVISKFSNDETQKEKKMLAFTTILVGLFSALMYRDIEVYEKRQQACWELFIKNNI